MKQAEASSIRKDLSNLEIRERIIETLRSTQRENIEAVISYMENNEFFSCGCHGHHKYDGGLAHHAWQTYQLAKKLEVENKRIHPNVPLLDANSLAICTLLHDFCDCKGLPHIEVAGSSPVIPTNARVKVLIFSTLTFLIPKFAQHLHNIY